MNYVGASSSYILVQQLNCIVTNVIFFGIREISSSGGAIKVYGKHDFIRIKHCSFYECGSYSVNIESKQQDYSKSCGGAIYVDVLLTDMKLLDVNFCCFEDCFAYRGEVLFAQKANKVLIHTNSIVPTRRSIMNILSFSNCNTLALSNMNISKIESIQEILEIKSNIAFTAKESYFSFYPKQNIDTKVINNPEKYDKYFENIMFHNDDPETLLNLITDDLCSIFINCSFMEGVNVSGKSKFINCYFAEPTDQNETLSEPIEVTFEQSKCNHVTEPIIFKKIDSEAPISTQFNHYSVTIEDCLFHDFFFYSLGIIYGYAANMFLSRTTFSACHSYYGPAIACFRSNVFNMTDVCAQQCFGTGSVLAEIRDGEKATFERSSFTYGVNYSHISICQIKCEYTRTNMKGINQSYCLTTYGFETFTLFGKEAILKGVNLIGNRFDSQESDFNMMCLGTGVADSMHISYFNVVNSSNNCYIFTMVHSFEEPRIEAQFIVLIDNNFSQLFYCTSQSLANVSYIYSNRNASLGDGIGELVIEEKSLYDLRNDIGVFCIQKKGSDSHQYLSYIILGAAGVALIISILIFLCIYHKYKGLAFVRDRILLEKSVLDDFG